MVRAVPHIVAPGQAVRLSRGTILVCFVQQTGEIFKGGENAVCVYVQRASMSEYGEDKQGFDDQASYEDGRRSYSRSPPPPPSFRGRPPGRRSPSRSPPRRQSSTPSPPSLHARPSASDQTLVLAYKPLREKPVPTCDASAHALKPKKLDKKIEKILHDVFV